MTDSENHWTVGQPALLERGSDRYFREFLHSFMVFTRCLEGVRDCLAKQIGVTPPQYEILSHLREESAEAGLTVTAIAERLHCTGPFATTEVGKLQRQGLVNKRRDPRDARRLFREYHRPLRDTISQHRPHPTPTQ